MDLKEVLDLVEKAEAGSRELDARMHAALVGGKYRAFVTSITPRRVDHIVDTERDSLYGFPAYTTSLDAIVGLVEREFCGLGWTLTPSINWQNEQEFWLAKVRMEPILTSYIDGIAKTPALALCAAYLRAKIAQGE